MNDLRSFGSKARNLISAVFSRFFSGVKLVIIGVLLAKSSGPEVFGSYNYIISFATLFTVISEFRLQNILVREISKSKEDSSKILGSAFGISLLLSLAGYAFLILTLSFYETDLLTRALIELYGLTFFFQTLRIMRPFFIANLLNHIILRLEIITALVILTLAMLAAYYRLGLKFFIILRVLDIAVFSILLLFVYRIVDLKRKNWKFNKPVAIRLIKDSLPLVLSSLSLVIFQQVDKIMLKAYLNEYAVGQYSAASSIISLIVFVPIVLGDTIAPHLVKSKEKLTREGYLRLAELYSYYIFWFTVILSFTVMIVSPIIIRAVYGMSFEDSIIILEVLVWQGVFIALGSISAQIMIIDENHQLAHLKSLSGGVLNIALNLYLIPKTGIMGAVWASMMAYFTSSYVSNLFISRYRYIFIIQTKCFFYGPYKIFDNLKMHLKANGRV